MSLVALRATSDKDIESAFTCIISCIISANNRTTEIVRNIKIQFKKQMEFIRTLRDTLCSFCITTNSQCEELFTSSASSSLFCDRFRQACLENIQADDFPNGTFTSILKSISFYQQYSQLGIEITRMIEYLVGGLRRIKLLQLRNMTKNHENLSELLELFEEKYLADIIIIEKAHPMVEIHDHITYFKQINQGTEQQSTTENQQKFLDIVNNIVQQSQSTATYKNISGTSPTKRLSGPNLLRHLPSKRRNFRQDIVDPAVIIASINKLEGKIALLRERLDSSAENEKKSETKMNCSQDQVTLLNTSGESNLIAITNNTISTLPATRKSIKRTQSFPNKEACSTEESQDELELAPVNECTWIMSPRTVRKSPPLERRRRRTEDVCVPPIDILAARLNEHAEEPMIREKHTDKHNRLRLGRSNSMRRLLGDEADHITSHSIVSSGSSVFLSSPMTSARQHTRLIINGSNYWTEDGDQPLVLTNELDLIKQLNSEDIIDTVSVDYWFTHYFQGSEYQSYLSKNAPGQMLCVMTVKKEKISKVRSVYRILYRTQTQTIGALVPASQLRKKIRGKNQILKQLLFAIDPLASAKTFIKCEADINDRLASFEQLEVSYLTKKRTTFKFGVLNYQEGNKDEEDMFSNQTISNDFREFLNLLGRKIELANWKGYDGGLDTSTKCGTGTHSVFTNFEDSQIMFHVAPYLPYSAHERQQLERKRHIGNDVIVIVFKETTKPFVTSLIASHFVHMVIVVGVEINSQGRKLYRCAISGKSNFPNFPPYLHDSGVFQNSAHFRKFLLRKLINAEKASSFAPAFAKRIETSRALLLRSIIEDYKPAVNIKTL